VPHRRLIAMRRLSRCNGVRSSLSIVTEAQKTRGGDFCWVSVVNRIPQMMLLRTNVFGFSSLSWHHSPWVVARLYCSPERNKVNPCLANKEFTSSL
jgi:hypothetical protein